MREMKCNNTLLGVLANNAEGEDKTFTITVTCVPGKDPREMLANIMHGAMENDLIAGYSIVWEK